MKREHHFHTPLLSQKSYRFCEETALLTLRAEFVVNVIYENPELATRKTTQLLSMSILSAFSSLVLLMHLGICFTSKAHISHWFQMAIVTHVEHFREAIREKYIGRVASSRNTLRRLCLATSCHF